MERTARGRYETHLDDPEFTVMEDGTRFAGFFLGDGEDDPAVFPMEVEPHILLSKVWNALAEKAEPGPAPVPGG